jgi:hypothetical protein
MRRFLIVLAGLAIAAPALAQKPPKRDRFKITSEELAEYKNSDLIEVISKARPHFFQFNAGSTSGMAEATMQGQAAQLLVYVGQQSFGDTSVLRHHKASDTKEIRYLRPSDAMVRLGANNSAVIQIIPVPVKQ